MKAYLLCGPSLAGKSTLAARLAEKLGTRILSADAINEERGLPFGAEGLPESVWADTLQILIDRLHSLLREGQSVAVDDTHCYRWLRDRLRDECDRASAGTVLLLLAPPEEELLRRLESLERDGKRPVLSRDRLMDHLVRFEWPGDEEHPIDVTRPEDCARFLQNELESTAPPDPTKYIP